MGPTTEGPKERRPNNRQVSGQKPQTAPAAIGSTGYGFSGARVLLGGSKRADGIERAMPYAAQPPRAPIAWTSDPLGFLGRCSLGRRGRACQSNDQDHDRRGSQWHLRQRDRLGSDHRNGPADDDASLEGSQLHSIRGESLFRKHDLLVAAANSIFGLTQRGHRPRTTGRSRRGSHKVRGCGCDQGRASYRKGDSADQGQDTAPRIHQASRAVQAAHEESQVGETIRRSRCLLRRGRPTRSG